MQAVKEEPSLVRQAAGAARDVEEKGQGTLGAHQAHPRHHCPPALPPRLLILLLLLLERQGVQSTAVLLFPLERQGARGTAVGKLRRWRKSLHCLWT